MCTQIGPSHAHPDPVEAATNSKQHGKSRQEAQGWLYTMSDIDLYLSPTQVDPEPTEPVVGFRPHQSLTKLAPQAADPKGDSGRHQTLLGTTLPQGQLLQRDSYMVIEVYAYSQPA